MKDEDGIGAAVLLRTTIVQFAHTYRLTYLNITDGGQPLQSHFEVKDGSITANAIGGSLPERDGKGGILPPFQVVFNGTGHVLALEDSRIIDRRPVGVAVTFGGRRRLAISSV